MAPPMAYSHRMVATDADLDPNSYTLEKYCLYETRAVYVLVLLQFTPQLFGNYSITVFSEGVSNTCLYHLLSVPSCRVHFALHILTTIVVRSEKGQTISVSLRIICIKGVSGCDTTIAEILFGWKGQKQAALACAED